MKVEFTRQFEKQAEELQNKKLKTEIAIAVKSVIVANTLSEIPNLKNYQDLKLHSYSYRKL